MCLACRNVSLMELYGIFPLMLVERLNHGTESLGLSFQIIFDTDLTLEQREEEWSSSVATQSLELLQYVPITSAACRLQPILLLSIAGQMRYSKSVSQPTQSPLESVDDENEICKNVDHNRWFIEARMLALSKKFPQKPLLRMIEITKEVWNRLDSGDDCHWMDVVNEKGWYTIMG